jgi:hypothetical protein
MSAGIYDSGVITVTRLLTRVSKINHPPSGGFSLGEVTWKT